MAIEKPKKDSLLRHQLLKIIQKLFVYSNPSSQKTIKLQKRIFEEVAKNPNLSQQGVDEDEDYVDEGDDSGMDDSSKKSPKQCKMMSTTDKRKRSDDLDDTRLKKEPKQELQASKDKDIQSEQFQDNNTVRVPTVEKAQVKKSKPVDVSKNFVTEIKKSIKKAMLTDADLKSPDMLNCNEVIRSLEKELHKYEPLMKDQLLVWELEKAELLKITNEKIAEIDKEMEQLKNSSFANIQIIKGLAAFLVGYSEKTGKEFRSAKEKELEEIDDFLKAHNYQE